MHLNEEEGIASMRGRVRLHSGGISPSEVRLRRRGASERRTAPGEDIRDFRPDLVQRCKYCNAETASADKYCKACMQDRAIVRETKALLRQEGLPPLGTQVPAGTPFSKKRRKAMEAQRRLDKRAKGAGLPSPRIPAPRTTEKKIAPKVAAPTRVRAMPRVKPTVKASGSNWSVSSVKSSSVCSNCFTERSVTGSCAC